MKILFVAARLCYPLNTGAKIRAYHVLRNLARRHEVTMLFCQGRQEEAVHFPAIEALGVRLVPVLNPGIDRRPGLRALGRCLWRDLPLTVAKYRSPAMAKALRALLQEGFDAVHCEHLHVFPQLQDAGVPLVLDAHNVESQIAERYAALEENPLRKRLFSWHHGRLARFEMRAVAAADLVLSVSAEDRCTFRALGAAGTIRVVENGVDVDHFRPAPREGRGIVFVGSMDWQPNRDGVDYFLDHVLPLVRRSHPSATFHVVGKSPSDALVRRAAGEQGVVVTGTVEDVRPYLERAAVCVVPLRVGGGTRLKVLEAFAMGKGVVSTTLGCEGIACRDGDHLLIADDAPSFAGAVCALLDNPRLARTLGERGRELVERRYSWRALGDTMLAHYDQLFQARARLGQAPLPRAQTAAGCGTEGA